jgi:hypothetical protein
VKVMLTSADALSVAWQAKRYLAAPAEGDDGAGTGTAGLLPAGVRDWLAALRLGTGVPFQYLVADDRLLPPESVRFFYLDRNWTDALIAGALSAGAITTSDRAQLQSLYPQVRDELDAAERLVRVPGNETGVDGAADVVTGLLVRSRAVSGWPAMHVRAFRSAVPDDGPDDDPGRLHLMRLERLGPSVLLALFDGVPAVVHLEEPRAGLQFGFELTDPQPEGSTVYELPLRSPATGLENGQTVAVPFRPGAPGVVDMAALQRSILANGGGASSGAEFALQALRWPYRQVFGQGKDDPGFPVLFTPQVSIDEIRAWPHYRPDSAQPAPAAEAPDRAGHEPGGES